MRRFIAGAVCPQCQQVDKIFLAEEDGVEYRQCVRCGFRDARPQDNDPIATEQDQAVGVVQMAGTHHRTTDTANTANTTRPSSDEQ